MGRDGEGSLTEECHKERRVCNRRLKFARQRHFNSVALARETKDGGYNHAAPCVLTAPSASPSTGASRADSKRPPHSQSSCWAHRWRWKPPAHPSTSGDLPTAAV